MNGIINQRFRQKLLIKFVEDAKVASADIHNVYLVFSYDSTRATQDISSNISIADYTSAHNGTTILAQYAKKVPAASLFYAVEATGGEDGVSINGVTYRTEMTIADLTRLWTSAYFTANVKQAGPMTFNTVTVLINLKSDAVTYFAADTIDAATLATATWTDAELIMQSRPADDDLALDEYSQFPILITF